MCSIGEPNDRRHDIFRAPPAETRQELDEYANATQAVARLHREGGGRGHLADRRAYLAAIDEAVNERPMKASFVSGEAVMKWLQSWGTATNLPPPEPDIFPDDYSVKLKVRPRAVRRPPSIRDLYRRR